MALRPRLVFGVLGATLIQLAVVLAAAWVAPVASGVDAPPVRVAAASGLYFDYLVTIVMENKNLCDVLTYCGGFAPYLTSLADSWGISAGALLQDLDSTANASNYMWFTPNECHNMHSCDPSIGDAYMSVLVPKIFGSTIFQTTRAALLITFDEAYGFPIYAVWSGPVAKTAYASSYGYTHFSVLATIESNWNLPPLTSNDRDAPHMGEFFLGQPSRGFRNPPPHPLALPYAVPFSGASALARIGNGVILLRREKRRSVDRATQ